MDVPAYLNRIQYHGPAEPTLATLRELHLAHLLAVPFENLDIHLGRPISLDLTALFDKIVTRRRGGFCYELNGLFAGLLDALGFEVTLLSASDVHADGTFGPEYDHLTLQVRIPVSGRPEPRFLPELWLADVGWGDSFRRPIRLDLPGEQADHGRVYWIERNGEYLTLVQRDAEGREEKQYRFTFQPRFFSEFEGTCRYHQTSPKSSFTQKRVCTLATPDGRLTLSELRLITTRNAERHERQLSSEEEYQSVLQQYFGIDLDLNPG